MFFYVFIFFLISISCKCDENKVSCDDICEYSIFQVFFKYLLEIHILYTSWNKR